MQLPVTAKSSSLSRIKPSANALYFDTGADINKLTYLMKQIDVSIFALYQNICGRY
jgi:hypothetical protein